MTVISEREIRDRVLEFIKERFLDGDPEHELADDTELLALGILDSLNTAVLMTFINENLGVRVPLARISARNFGSVCAIATMINDLLAGAAAPHA
jgi:acyl carrier protein